MAAAKKSTAKRGRPAKAEQVKQEPVSADDQAESKVDDGYVEELLTANEEFAKRDEENAQRIAELEAKLSAMAKDNPVSTTHRDETGEHQIGQDDERRFDDEGSIIQPETKTMDDPNMIRKADLEQFMNQPVTVEIGEMADDQEDEAGFVIEVNRKKEFFRRGERKTVKRMFVEGLARAKKTGYGNKLVTDQQTGEQEYVYPSRTGLRYPFSVIEDKDPRGAAWLKAVLRQP